MTKVRCIKLIRKGSQQILHIPHEFDLPGNEAVIRKDGARLVIEPLPRKSLLAILASLQPIGETFPPIAELSIEPVDL